jgi:aminopeptidase YwaD
MAGNVLFMHGDLTTEQLMPKNFPFYNPEHHRSIYQLLEARQPAAIIAATGRNPELAGGVYPFPLIEDGDFSIPVAHMTDVEGARLLGYEEPVVALKMDATRTPARGCNVIGRAGLPAPSRVVVCAHIDAKDGTPGAIDNGSGVVVLLLLAQLLAGSEGSLGIELLAINGEDYYSAPGEVTYLQVRKDELDQVQLAINLDGAGYIEGATEYSLYECPESLRSVIHSTFSDWDELAEGGQWYQSDHTIFVQNGRPAVAITSAEFMRLSAEVTHTPKDKPEIVDPEKLVQIAHAIRALIENLGRS